MFVTKNKKQSCYVACPEYKIKSGQCDCHNLVMSMSIPEDSKSEIPKTMSAAIPMLESALEMEFEIQIIGSLKRDTPDEYTPLGKLGVNCLISPKNMPEINPVKFFLTNQVCEDAVSCPRELGQMIIDELIFLLFVDQFKKLINKDEDNFLSSEN